MTTENIRLVIVLGAVLSVLALFPVVIYWSEADALRCRRYAELVGREWKYDGEFGCFFKGDDDKFHKPKDVP